MLALTPRQPRSMLAPPLAGALGMSARRFLGWNLLGSALWAGVAVLAPNETNSPEALVQLADQALYRAKQKGRNQALLAMDDAEAA